MVAEFEDFLEVLLADFFIYSMEASHGFGVDPPGRGL